MEYYFGSQELSTYSFRADKYYWFHKRLKITSIGFHKRSNLGRNKSWDQDSGLGTKFQDQSLQASKRYLKCKYRPENWITCSL